jgi:hypothetical protein
MILRVLENKSAPFETREGCGTRRGAGFSLWGFISDRKSFTAWPHCQKPTGLSLFYFLFRKGGA